MDFYLEILLILLVMISFFVDALIGLCELIELCFELSDLLLRGKGFLLVLSVPITLLLPLSEKIL